MKPKHREIQHSADSIINSISEVKSWLILCEIVAKIFFEMKMFQANETKSERKR
jgi:hypothetical protein